MPKPKATTRLSKTEITLPKPLYWLSPILIVAGLFRLYNLNAVAIWHNEGVTAAFAKTPWPQIYQTVVADSVGPLYYLLQKIWSSVMGFNTYSLRLLPVTLGLLGVYATYVLVRNMLAENDEENPGKSEWLALFATLLVSLSPLQIQYSQSAQPYALAVLMTVCSTYFLSRLIRSGKFSDSVIYAVTVAAMLYVHESLLLTLGVHLLFAIYLIFKKPSAILPGQSLRALFSLLLGLILALPQLIHSAPTLSRYDFGFVGLGESIEMIWRTLFAGTGTNRIIASLGVLVIITAIFYFIKSAKTPFKWLILLSWFLPFVASVTLTPAAELDLPLYLVTSSVFLIIMVASAVFAAPSFKTRQILVIGLALFSILIFFKNWNDLDVKNLFFGRFENRKPGMLSAMKFVNDSARNEDKIFAGSPYVLFSTDYYNRTPIKPLLYSPEELPSFLGKNLAQARVVTDFSSAQKNDTAWVIWSRGFGGSKPVVPGNWEIIAEKYYMDAPAFKGLIVVSEYHVD